MARVRSFVRRAPSRPPQPPRPGGGDASTAGAEAQPRVAYRILSAFATAYPQAVFLQIGANDGQRYDPLAHFVGNGEWTGVMVEPVPHIFERLRSHLAGNDRVEVENLAIAEQAGIRPFYYVAEPVDEAERLAVDWYDAIGSFDRVHLLKHKAVIPNLANRIETLMVPTMTVAGLCAAHGIRCPDLVLIDAEGYDGEILASIDFERIRPRLVIYEHHHLPAEARERCEARLRGLDYGLREDGLDTWCLDLRVRDALAERWPELPDLPPA